MTTSGWDSIWAMYAHGHTCEEVMAIYKSTDKWLVEHGIVESPGPLPPRPRQESARLIAQENFRPSAASRSDVARVAGTEDINGCRGPAPANDLATALDAVANRNEMQNHRVRQNLAPRNCKTIRKTSRTRRST